MRTPSVPPSPFLNRAKSLLAYARKSAGRCKRGQTAAQTDCIPESNESSGGGGRQQKPLPEPFGRGSKEEQERRGKERSEKQAARQKEEAEAAERARLDKEDADMLASKDPFTRTAIRAVRLFNTIVGAGKAMLGLAKKVNEAIKGAQVSLAFGVSEKIKKITGKDIPPETLLRGTVNPLKTMAEEAAANTEADQHSEQQGGANRILATVAITAAVRGIHAVKKKLVGKKKGEDTRPEGKAMPSSPNDAQVEREAVIDLIEQIMKVGMEAVGQKPLAREKIEEYVPEAPLGEEARAASEPPQAPGTPFAEKSLGDYDSKAAKRSVRGHPCPPGYTAKRDGCTPRGKKGGGTQTAGQGDKKSDAGSGLSEKDKRHVHLMAKEKADDTLYPIGKLPKKREDRTPEQNAVWDHWHRVYGEAKQKLTERMEADRDHRSKKEPEEKLPDKLWDRRAREHISFRLERDDEGGWKEVTPEDRNWNKVVRQVIADNDREGVVEGEEFVVGGSAYRLVRAGDKNPKKSPKSTKQSQSASVYSDRDKPKQSEGARMKASKNDFDPHQYAIDRGWDFSHIKATAEDGLSEEDEAAIDEWAGVHDPDWDPPTDEDAEREADAVSASKTAAKKLLEWCKAKVAEKQTKIDQTKVRPNAGWEEEVTSYSWYDEDGNEFEMSMMIESGETRDGRTVYRWHKMQDMHADHGGGGGVGAGEWKLDLDEVRDDATEHAEQDANEPPDND